MALATGILIVSFALQLTAAVLAVRLIRFTRARLAWTLIAAAAVLMGGRRAVSLHAALVQSPPRRPDLEAELIALAISVLMVVGLAMLGPLFRAMRHSFDSIRRSEQKYRELVDRLPLAVIETDREGRLTFANPAAHELLGFEPGELGPRWKALDFIVPRERDTASGLLALGFGGEEIPATELRVIRKDGTPVDVLASATPIFESETVVGIRGIAVDLTERRRLEGQLLQAQKMEAVGRLAGGIAHDFNNLLTVILGYGSNLLRRLEAGTSERTDVEEIVRAGNRAASLTRQLLAFGRRQVMQPRVVELEAIVLAMEGMLRRLIGEDVEMEVDLASQPWRVKADPAQIEQVVVNLAVNARDAMPRGGRLVVRTRNLTFGRFDPSRPEGLPPGDSVVLEVEDSGTGISEAVRSHLFEPFFTTKEQGKGTGLGLATVYGIVRQSGGSVAVESEPGRGTLFRVFLPRTDEEAAADDPPRPEASRADASSVSILVVEDEPQVREVAREVLAAAGYRVLTAANAEEGIETSERHDGPIHLLLSDVVMPGLSGPALAERLVGRRPELRVLLMSGHSEEMLASRGLAARGWAFLPKPWTPAALLEKVVETLRRRGL